MQQILSAKLTQIAITAACAAMLAACGGGGGDNSSNSGDKTEQPGDGGNTSTSISLADQKQGLPSESNSYTLTLAVGDTWRLTLDPAALTYTITIVQTAALATGSTPLAAGNQYTGSYTLSNGTMSAANGDWELRVNTDTQTATGSIQGFNGQALRLAGKLIASQATGSIYKAPADLSRFKGTYFVTGGSHNASDSAHPWGFAGQMRIADDGKHATLCANGIFNDSGKCAAVDPSEPSAEGVFDLATDSATGMVKVSNSAGQQGWMRFQPSTLGGYSLVYDQLGLNGEGIQRTGITYGSQIPNLKAGDIDGTFVCRNATTSKTTGTIKVNGNRVQIISSDYNATEVMTFNQVQVSNGKILKVPGIAESVPVGRPDEGAILHPFSQDQILVEEDGGAGSTGYPFSICTRS